MYSRRQRTIVNGSDETVIGLVAKKLCILPQPTAMWRPGTLYVAAAVAATKRDRHELRLLFQQSNRIY